MSDRTGLVEIWPGRMCRYEDVITVNYTEDIYGDGSARVALRNGSIIKIDGWDRYRSWQIAEDIIKRLNAPDPDDPRNALIEQLTTALRAADTMVRRIGPPGQAESVVLQDAISAAMAWKSRR